MAKKPTKSLKNIRLANSLRTWCKLAGCGGMLLLAAPYLASTTLRYDIKGLSPDLLKNARARLDDYIRSYGNNLNQAQLYNIYHNAPKELEHAVEPFGYFSATVNKQLNRSASRWLMHFNVKPGPQTMLTKVSVVIEGEGKTDATFEKAVQDFPLKTGDPLNTVKYQQGKQKLLNLAATRGYFAANLITSKILINRKQHQASINIIYQTGPRYRFGATSFSSKFLSATFLKKYLPYKAGEYYDASKISTLQTNLSSSNYFDGITITPETTAKDIQPGHQVPIAVKLTPSPPRQYQVGLGYGSDTGLRGLFGFTIRHLNSRGHKFNTLIRMSKVSRYLTSAYVIPGNHPAYENYTISAGLGQQDLSTGSSKNYRLGLSHASLLGSISQTLSLDYLNEDYNIPSLFPGEIKTNMLLPSAEWSVKYSDDLLNPNNGYSFSTKVSGALKSLMASESFVQATFEANILKTFFEDNRILFHLNFGTTQINDLDKLPLSLQLFAGGADSIRGYGYHSLGPGRYLLTSSIELQRRIYGAWYLAGFYDAGNVANNFIPKLKAASGAGLVWLSPIGPFELDFARPIASTDHRWHIQFSMGSSI